MADIDPLTVTGLPTEVERTESDDAALTKPPECIGRYRIERVLGKGGFGMVFLAHDEQLNRRVAVKVPHARLVSRPEDAQTYVAEARTVANLDHPHIVPVYDVGSTGEIPCYVVSKYIEGADLATRLKHFHLSCSQAAIMVATVAEALHYAHNQGLVHRDVKPGNILLDKSDEPFVVDFGVALREQDVGEASKYAGTPAYMSPEQARGEGHRVDGRSDIFSLGVVLYELLTGRRPFHGDSKTSLLVQIATLDPKPPRQISDAIPQELERICLRALAKRASDRYTTARDFADDLRHFIQKAQKTITGSGPATDSTVTAEPLDGGSRLVESTPSSTRAAAGQVVRIVPKGLRSFDEHDSDYFLELLPGPRDRQRLPDSIRFWKTRIEERSSAGTFTVGLIYGPSGCGKSSLVKAGLLPRLSDQVLTVYVEAAPEETEHRLLNGLRKQCRTIGADLGLKDTLAELRRGEKVPIGKTKVLIVLDQFEQWLHARKDDPQAELVQALRQCDGDHVQCLVLVRDDFYVAVNRFFRQLEVPILEGHNYALVDLFDLDHACKVLTAFGRAYGKVAKSSDPTVEQRTFLAQAVAGLAQDGKVISVRLALFAEMMKGRAWNTVSLREVGGTEGVGATFLEETFSARTASPTHRLHQDAAREVLKTLLPATGTDIKGQMQPIEKLRELSGYTKRPDDFRALLAILESEVRLIAPTEPGSTEADDGPEGAKYYQLTHDFLVPALREWLARKQKESRRGRAELRLAERTAFWTSKPEQKQLPSWWETLQILAFTRRSAWTDSQSRMMRLAIRRQATRLAGSGLMVLVAATALIAHRRNLDRAAQADRGNQLVDQLLVADAERLPELLRTVQTTPAVRFDRLHEVADGAETPYGERLRAHLALVPTNHESVGFLLDSLETADPRIHAVVCLELRSNIGETTPRLWQVLCRHDLSNARRLRVAAALSDFDPKNETWREVASDVGRALVDENPASVTPWVERLRPVSAFLVEALKERFHDTSAPAAVRVIAAGILARFAEADPRLLASLIVAADAEQFELLIGPLTRHGRTAVRLLESRLANLLAAGSQSRRDQLVRMQANAAMALMRLGRADHVWRFLEQILEPDVRTDLIATLERFHVPARDLIERLDVEDDPVGRYSILLALGEWRWEGLSEHDRDEAARRAGELYLRDVDSGVHGAAAWLLRAWGQPTARANAAPGDPRNWHVTVEGQLMCELPGPVEFLMGSPEDETGRDPIEPRREVRIPRAFAISAHEVTHDEYRRFVAETLHAPEIGPDGDCPVNKTSWLDAARYCRWLSEREGLTEDEMVYPPLNQIEKGMELPAESLLRTGYRLPTEAEWEFACRGGARTKWFFGQSDEPLTGFGWYLANSNERTWPVGTLRPNPFGMFDMHGNVHEWCHDAYDGEATVPVAARTDVELGGPDVYPGERLFRGGSYRSMTRLVRTAKRYSYPPGTHLSAIGFRIARTMPARSESSGE